MAALFAVLDSIANPPKKKSPTVHGLSKVKGRALRQLPIQITGEQVAFTCLCGSGWLTICVDGGQDEAFRQHVEAARSNGAD